VQGWLLALALAAAGRPQLAIRRLGRLCGELGGSPGEIHYDLARLLGSQTLAETRISFADPLERRRVFDVFPFDGELTTLEIKLHEMAAWVDRFVLVEARTSLDGEPKPLCFEQNRARFAAFADRITHVVVDAFPEHVDTPWARAIFLRDQGLRGLDGACAPQDLVLLTDADEVLDERGMAALEGPFDTCEVRAFSYFLNLRRAGAGRIDGAAAVEARFLTGVGLSEARIGLRLYRRSRIADAGWRFGDIPDSGAPDPVARSAEQAAVLEEIRAGSTPAGFQRAPLDESFPRYVRERSEGLAGLILGD
jgi:hypothetical protein